MDESPERFKADCQQIVEKLTAMGDVSISLAASTEEQAVEIAMFVDELAYRLSG